MCGIAGLFDTRATRSFSDTLIARMTDVIAHRGPDGSGLHQEPGLALGHRRLAIIDLAGGIQPMHTTDGALKIVFNGEIYNFQALRHELEALGAVFLTNSDTEVLLHGWRHWKTAINPVTHAHRATNGVITSAWRRAKTSRFLGSGGFVFWIRSTPWYSNELHSFRAFHTIVGEKRTSARRTAR